MEIHNMISFIRLIMWIYDIGFVHMSNMVASSSWSNDLNQKRVPDKNTFICVSICGQMKKNIENSGHGFLRNVLNYLTFEKISQNNHGLRDRSGFLNEIFLDLLFQLVFQISNLLKQIPSWEFGSSSSWEILCIKM